MKLFRPVTKAIRIALVKIYNKATGKWDILQTFFFNYSRFFLMYEIRYILTENTAILVLERVFVGERYRMRGVNVIVFFNSVISIFN